VSTDISRMRRLGELHLIQARSHALRLVAHATAVYPEEWTVLVVEQCSLELLEFAFHARRVNQLCGIEDHQFNSVDQRACVIAEGDPKQWMTNYKQALSRLHHASDFVFGWAHADHRKLYTTSSANLVPLYVKVATDNFPEATISIFGVASCFLNEVIGLIKQSHPEWQF
jgi:hypothetical protein